MNQTNYYRNDSNFAWRFSNLRSGQPAASDRSLTGGIALLTANPANCRTPQEVRAGIPAGPEALT